MRLHRTTWALAAIVLIAALGYVGALGGDFVFDDIRQVQRNPLILDLGNYLGSWAGYRAAPTRFVGFASFALNYRLFGGSVAAFRAVNVAIHMANAFLVYALVVLVFRTPRLSASALAPSARAVAFAAAILFAAHPLETEAVTYVVQRFTSLAAFFSLACAVLYIRWRLAAEQGGSRLRRAASYLPILATALLAMKTKESALALPFAIALTEVVLFDGSLPSRLLYLAPTVAILPLVLVAGSLDVSSAVLKGQSVQTIGWSDVTGSGKLTPLTYLLTQFTVLPAYLRLLAFPIGQSGDHDHTVYRSLLDPTVAFSLAFIVGLVVLAVYLVGESRRGRPLDPAFRLVGFGILWFFATVFVDSSVVPLADVMAERRVYLPSVGVLIAFAVIAALVWSRATSERWAQALVATAAVLSLVLAAVTASRNAVWHDALSFWADAAAKAPRKPRPHNNLGLAYLNRGRVDDAIREMEIAVDLAPEVGPFHTNLGIAYQRRGMQQQAEQQMEVARSLPPAPW